MYKNLLEYIAKNLVAYPEKVEISEISEVSRAYTHTRKEKAKFRLKNAKRCKLTLNLAS